MKEYGGFGAFRYVKYDSRIEEVKRKIEESVVCTLLKFRLVPLEVTNSLPKSLYLHIDNRWKYAINSEKKMRERSLVHLFPDILVDKISEHLKNYQTNFLVKQRALKMMNGLYLEVEKETKEKWQEIFQIKSADEQGEVEIVDITEQDPAGTIQLDEDIMDTEIQEQEMIEGNAYAKLVSSESVLEQVKSYPLVTQHVSTETPRDTEQGKEGQ